MSQNINKGFKMPIIMQKVNETGGKINLPRICWQPCKKMDPLWPFASSHAFYMPFRAMNPDPRISLGHQEVNCSQPTCDAVILKHVQEAGDTSLAISSADSDSPLNLSAVLSAVQQGKSAQSKGNCCPTEITLGKKKAQGKREHKLNDAEDGNRDKHFRQAFDENDISAMHFISFL